MEKKTKQIREKKRMRCIFQVKMIAKTGMKTRSSVVAEITTNQAGQMTESNVLLALRGML